MNILFLIIYFVIILAVIEIFVILFRLTGLKKEVSRFQVISMMTGTGFTTGESELILGHPVRRKLATFLILFGAFSLAVIISSISQFLSEGLRLGEVLSGAVTVIVVFCVLKLERTQQVLFEAFHQKMKPQIELADLPIRDLFLKNKEDAFINLHIYYRSHLANKTISQVVIEHDELELVVLFIQRGEVRIRKNIYDTTLHEGDQVLIYGSKQVISQIFITDITIMNEEITEG
jgi:hypothetical protein